MAPTTTMWSRIRSAGTRPSYTSENETVGIVPGGPRKSIQALLSRKPLGSGPWPVSRSAVTTAMLSSFPAERGKLAMAPLVSLRRSEAAARAPMLRRLSSPPRTLVRPFGSLSLVASTAPSAVADRVEEGEVVAQARLLGELDVVDDLARAGGVQAADHLSV